MPLNEIGLNESTRVPLYFQLTEQIYEQIKKGSLKAGDLLPSERELCEKYGLSRGTVRQGINLLVNKGYISRKQGKGTVVKYPVFEHDLIGDYSFGKGILRQGLKTSSIVLFCGIINGKKRITNRLNMESHDKLIQISRIRRANNEPWIMEDSYLPERDFSGLEKVDFTSHLLVDVLTQQYGIHLNRIEAFIEPTIAQEHHEEVLDVKIGSPALVLDRILFDQNNKPIVYSQAFVRGDRCRYYFKIKR